MKTFVKFVIRLFLLLLVLVCGTVIYLDLNGFPPFLKGLVEKQLFRQGVAAHFSSIRLDVLRGVIAKEAVLAYAKVPEQTLARIDEVQIDWNWPRLLHGQNGIDALRIANASVTVPTPADEIGPQVFIAEQAYATFRFEDGSIQIDELNGVYAGIRLHLAGEIKLRSTSISDLPIRRSDSARSPFIFITKALRELNDLHGSEPPQLDVTFDLDLASPIDSRVTAKLVAADVVYRKINVENLLVDVAMTEGAIDIHQMRLKVGKGELSINGRYDVAAGGVDLKLVSSLDPNLFLPSLPAEANAALRDLHVWDPPKIEAHYLLSPETGVLPVLQGRVEFGALEFHSVPFRSIAFSFENKGAVVKVTDAKIVMREGQLTGHGQYQMETSDFSYEIDSTLDPRKLLPLMFKGQQQIVEPSWFETAPHIVASVRGDFVDPEAFAYDATLNVDRCSYRGVALNSVSADIKMHHNQLDVRHLNVQRDEGEAVGAVQADFETHRIGFDLSVTANPSQMMPLLGPKPTEVMHPYRFGPRTRGTARGLIDLDVLSNTCWEAHVSNEDFSYWKLAADKATADVAMTNSLLRIDNFDADFYGGRLRGKAVFNLAAKPGYQFDFTTDKVDLRKLLPAITGKESGVSGLMTGQAVISGQGSDLDTIKGKGAVSVENGVLWEIPFFGIFSHILNGIGTGLGSTKATKADASFKIEDKSVKTDDLTVAAGAVTVTGSGKVGFDGKLDFLMTGQLLRSWPGVDLFTWFLAHAFKYKIGGTLGNYTYRPVNLPKEFLPHGGGAAKDKSSAEPVEVDQ